MAVVLHQNTGHVSLQFHVKFDPSFHTVQQDQLDCTWQQSTYFIQVSHPHASPLENHKMKQSALPKQTSKPQQSSDIWHDANKASQQ